MKDLPADRRDEYGVCVALHQGVLRLPAEGQYLWSPDVEDLVGQLQDHAVGMATTVLIDGVRYPDDHGHDLLDKIAAELRRAMRVDLERDPSEPRPEAGAAEG
jgi:hypothetical protein